VCSPRSRPSASRGWPGIGFVGVVTAYVVAGLLLVRGRQSDRAVTIFRFRLRVRRELAVLGVVAGVALGALGLLLLGRV
jgi:hypothetical protein